VEEITMREDYGNINLDSGGDDGFGDVPGMEVDGEESHTELRGDQVGLFFSGTFGSILCGRLLNFKSSIN
jgi:hypothetical protein